MSWRSDGLGGPGAETMSKHSAEPRLESDAPNPRRVAAGRINRSLRRGLTEAGRHRLRESALRSQPWKFAIGPKSATARQQSAQNGKVRQIGILSIRECRALTAELTADLSRLRQIRQQAASRPGENSS